MTARDLRLRDGDDMAVVTVTPLTGDDGLADRAVAALEDLDGVSVE